MQYDKRDTYGAAIHLWRTVSRIRAGRPYDVVYLAQGSFRSALLAMMTGAKERIGFATSAASALYTRRVEYKADRHHSERLWWLSMSDCADPPSREQLAVRLFPSDEDRGEVNRLLADSNLAGGDFVALAPGSAWGTKRWPYFEELAELISKDHKLVIVGSGADCEIAAQILERVAPGRCVDACGKLKILASAELIGRARAIRVQRLSAGTSRFRDGHTDPRAFWADRSGVRIRTAGLSAGDSRGYRPRLPPV
jgi:ADP-heptose:LPS heptosyltransferase